MPEKMKLSDLLENPFFDINAIVRVFAGGAWGEDGTEVGRFSCGNAEFYTDGLMDAHVTYIATDDDGRIVIECDLDVKGKAPVPETALVMTLSTAHIEQSTYELLTAEAYEDIPVYLKNAPNGTSYGVFVYLTPGDEYMGLGCDDLAKVASFAMERGCRILCLDSDGPIMKDLPSYAWDEE